MFPLSIHIKQGLARLILPALFFLTFLIILIGQTYPKVIEKVRLNVNDFLAPGYALVEQPFNQLSEFFDNLKNLQNLVYENHLLKYENGQLRRWYYVATGLAEENAILKTQLHWVPDPKLSYITARVVADISGVYHRAVLVYLTSSHHVQIGNIVLNGYGFVGRVTEVGKRSARILLINDEASKIPVYLNDSHIQAIMEGDSSEYPKLIYYPEDKHPQEGEKVITDNKGNALPAGIPIGYVHYIKQGVPIVVPYLSLNQLRIVRIFDYGNQELPNNELPGRKDKSSKRIRKVPVASSHLLEYKHND